MVQMEIARVTLLETDLIQAFKEDMDYTESVEAYQRKLQDWFSELPSELRLSSLADRHALGTHRRLIYFVHLIHLASLNILYRQLMIRLTDDHPRQNQADNNQRLRRIAQNIGTEGTLAAKQGCRILHLLLKENALFQKSWLCV
jgi:hypothetical protein